MRRRLHSTTLVLVSQMLLIALALAWLFQMIIIASEGSAYFIENNAFILYGEVAIIALIIFFAIYVFIIQIRRLSERRGTDRIDEDRRD
jgi:membrane protein YdbS with pleckstrin-like domain